jgi:tRNA-2-methylthio-N6-dimethylallyladenosine synthase
VHLPVQSGSTRLLKRMGRRYTREQYLAVVDRLRRAIPGLGLTTDIIVGFPGETVEQFEQTYQVLADLKLDKAHLAMYSPRPNTVSARTMPDDVPPSEKRRRLQTLEQLQEQVAGEINRRYLGQTVEVLFEDQHRGKWRGRTRQNKLVFVEHSGDLRGKLVDVEITWTGPWSMQARLPGEAGSRASVEVIPLVAAS